MTIKRTDVPVHQTWDLSPLFPDFDAWEKAFAALPSEETLRAEIDAKFRGKLKQGPELIFAALSHRDTTLRPLENLYVYANLRNTEDLGEARSSESGARIGMRYAQLSAAFSYLNPELLELDKLGEWKEQAPLSAYRYELTEILRGKAHVLSEAEETLLAQLSPVLWKFREIHSKWSNVDLKFPDAKDSAGNPHPVTHARSGLHMESPDRTLRRTTFESYYGEMAKWRNTICENFNGRFATGTLLARIKRFPGFLESQLFGDEIPVALYDTLVGTVRKNLPQLQRSMALRQRILGVERLAPYDRNVSLAQIELPRFTWEQGKELVLKSLKPLGEAYLKVAAAGLGSERWCDHAENQGKRSGAFSWGTYDSKPYMLMTWTGTLGDVFTLAHELGHSMHSYLANRAQPYHLAGYTIFVAEVASTLNEALLCNHILTQMPGTDLAREAVSYWLRGFENTVLRQVLFAAFERECAKLTDAQESLTPDRCDALFSELNREWYGPSMELPHELGAAWMSVPHFYNTFYVYKYATSYCASLSLCNALLKEGAPAQERVLGMLRAGGSKPPLEIMKDAGVDFLSGAPVNDAFRTYDANITRAEQLFLHKAERSA